MSEIKSWWERMPFGADDLKADYMQSEIDELRAALAEAEKDAGYYRKLRSGDVDNYAVADLRDGIFNGEVYGTALDQAMQGGE